jgi:phosphocarrier protein HPr
MFQKEVTITSSNGFDMSLASQFVKEAKGFTSVIAVISNGRSASARRPLDLISLGLKQGSIIMIQAEGSDAQKAVERLAALLDEFK